MVGLTDPARELADICSRLSITEKHQGDVFLAKQFGVEPWSTEFFQILFNISDRVDFLIEILKDLDIDDDYREEMRSHLIQIKQAFSPSGLSNNWSHAVQNFIGPATVGPVKVLSGMVRKNYAYPKLDDDEKREILGYVDSLLDWLNKQQLSERDFIRQAIIDGLTQFRFRLNRIEWLGWGYSLDALKEVIGAYLALERGMIDKETNPDAEAVLRKTAALVGNVLKKVGFVRQSVGDISFMLLAYEQIVQVSQGSAPISGLLTFLKS